MFYQASVACEPLHISPHTNLSIDSRERALVANPNMVTGVRPSMAGCTINKLLTAIVRELVAKYGFKQDTLQFTVASHLLTYHSLISVRSIAKTNTTVDCVINMGVLVSHL